MLMHTQRPHRITRRRNLPHRSILPNIPQFDLAIPASRDQFSEAATLHMDVGDPLLVTPPMLHHCHRRLFARVEDANCAVAVAGAEDVAGDLVGGEGCYAGAGAGGDVLWVVQQGLEEGGWRRFYVGADFGGCIPYSDDFDISSYQQLTLALLPVQYKPCVFVAGDQICQCAESGHQLDTLFRFVVSEDLNHTVGRARQQQSVVVFIDESRFIDAGALWIAIGEAAETSR